MPEIVPAEFKPVSVDVQVEETEDKWVHPITGSSQRYILGDRFHSTTNPHKSPLCNFHDINLCLQANALKTSYQEAENNRKNKKRLQSACVQGFGTHFLFNFLMDFYQNEMIVHKQLLNLKIDSQKVFKLKGTSTCGLYMNLLSIRIQYRISIELKILFPVSIVYTQW